jgi:hypothetical protein
MPFFKCIFKDLLTNLNVRGRGFFVSFRIFISDNTRVRIFIYLSREARNLFPEFNIRLYDKNYESDYFSFLHQNQNIRIENIICFNLQKNTVVFRCVWYLVVSQTGNQSCVHIHPLGNDHLTWRGVMIFSKKIFWFLMLLKKIFAFIIRMNITEISILIYKYHFIGTVCLLNYIYTWMKSSVCDFERIETVQYTDSKEIKTMFHSILCHFLSAFLNIYWQISMCVFCFFPNNHNKNKFVISYSLWSAIIHTSCSRVRDRRKIWQFFLNEVSFVW